MEMTYTAILENNNIIFHNESQTTKMSIFDFENLIPRRQRKKIPMTNKIALALFKHYSLNDKIIELGGSPQNIPIIICNRYANWDFVAESMTSDIDLTLNNINNYVATAWFPASIQGFLTIEYGNKAEAITLATEDKKLLLSTIESFLKDKEKVAIILGTFECFPKKIANHDILGDQNLTFGAISIISQSNTIDSIRSIINLHQGLYSK